MTVSRSWIPLEPLREWIGWTPPTGTVCHAGRNIDDPWFGKGTWSSPSKQDPDLARTLCRPCAYRTECLTKALRVERGLPASDRYGVWGGTVPVERARIEDGDMAWPESAA